MMHLHFFLLLLIGEAWSATLKDAGAQNYVQDLDDDSKNRQSDTILVIIESFRTIHERLDMLEKKIENEMDGLHRQLEDSDRKIEKVHHNIGRNTKLIETLSNTCSKEHITTEKPSTASPATTPKAATAPLVLFANGNHDPGSCHVIELSSNRPCKSIARYPLNVRQAGGSLINGLPLVCGGFNVDLDRVDSECFVYVPNIGSWRFHARLPEPRRNHAAVTINNTVWISGGMTGEYSGAYKDYKSTLFIHGDGKVERGPDLPTAKGSHCVVDLKDGRYMVIGGDTGNLGNTKLKEVFIYNPSNSSFAIAPSLSIGRAWHACALFYSPLNNYRPTIIVLGGGSWVERSVETLDFTISSAVWEKQESLPSGHDWYAAEAVSSGNDVYVLLQRSLYQLIWNGTRFTWRKTDHDLDDFGSYPVTMVLPNEYSCED